MWSGYQLWMELSCVLYTFACCWLYASLPHVYAKAAFTLKHFQSKTTTSYSFTWRHCSVYSNTFPPKMLHIIVIINAYPRQFHVTTIPHARSRDALGDIPSKQVEANKKKQFVWKDDEAQLLLAVTHDYKIKHLVEGTCDYRQTKASVFITLFIFTVYMSVFERFPLLHFQSLHLGLQIQKSPFLVCVFIILV